MTIGSEEKRQLDAVRRLEQVTRRPVSKGLEDLLHQVLPVLDHGFVRVVDYMGDDSSVVQAARVSYGTGTRKKREDHNLINYLMQHNHTTPFEMAEIKLHVKLPIFVARQWIRHRTASVNEYSARYSVLDREFYVPDPENLAAQSPSNRQGRETILHGDEAREVLQMLRDDAETAYEHYQYLLNEDSKGKKRDEKRQGLARELARLNLSVNFYTQWYWKVDLHNLLRFLQLRADSHAQYEIRVYADLLLNILECWVPLTALAFREHRLDATVLSRTATNVIKEKLAGKSVSFDDSGLSKREWNNLTKTLGL